MKTTNRAQKKEPKTQCYEMIKAGMPLLMDPAQCLWDVVDGDLRGLYENERIGSLAPKWHHNA